MLGLQDKPSKYEKEVCTCLQCNGGYQSSMYLSLHKFECQNAVEKLGNSDRNIENLIDLFSTTAPILQ